jgi:hypothetical protein
MRVNECLGSVLPTPACVILVLALFMLYKGSHLIRIGDTFSRSFSPSEGLLYSSKGCFQIGTVVGNRLMTCSPEEYLLAWKDINVVTGLLRLYLLLTRGLRLSPTLIIDIKKTKKRGRRC